MVEEKEKEIIGYYTDNGNIYCVECINKDNEIMKKIEQAITEEDSEEGLYFCEGCEKEIK
jgi:CobQ-like glutamine amidotransferase family enzyme